MTTITLHEGDNIAKMRALPAMSVDSIVTDPPYMLTSINKRFGANNATPAKYGRDGAFARASAGFMGSKWDSPNVEPAIDTAFAHWFAGFVDGEGCFTVNEAKKPKPTFNCRFDIVVRDDDRDILVECQRQLGGIGTLAFDRPSANPNAGSQARWTISSKADCQRLRAVLSVFPLRAKKARDFEIWCHALDSWVNHERGSDWSDVEFYRDQLQLVKKFGSFYKPDMLFHYRWATEALRVLKPGGYILAFSSPRTGHWQAAAMEAAGFVMHPFLGWLYGQGMPKAHNAAMAIDKHLGVKGGRGAPRSAAHAGWIDRGQMRGGEGHDGWQRPWMEDEQKVADAASRYLPASPEAQQWDGWSYGGQALKPALEPIYVGQRPFSEKNGAANFIKHGVGAINIDACRAEGGQWQWTSPRGSGLKFGGDKPRMVAPDETGVEGVNSKGRHPANLIHDGSDDVVALFPQSAGQLAPVKGTEPSRTGGEGTHCYGEYADRLPAPTRGDSGSAARFFNECPPDDAQAIYYHGKATKADRAGSKHPTVKPITLMRWLVRLVTPAGGVVLDPFGGSGTTGEAARQEGFDCVLMEADERFAADIRGRFGLGSATCTAFDDLLGGDDEDDLDALLG